MINQPKIQHEDNLTTRERWLSMLLDHAIFVFILVPIMILLSSLYGNMDNNWSRISFLFLIVVYFQQRHSSRKKPCQKNTRAISDRQKDRKACQCIKMSYP